MRKILVPLILISILSLAPFTAFSETIDVQIKGVDDGVKTTKQRDYKEAVLFAKREAIERAGVQIKAITTMKDLVLYSDYIESKAEAVLLPGYNILDMGYSADGTYQIVLIGKVKTVSEGVDSKELRYAKSLMERGQKAETKRIITDIIKNSKDDNVVAEAMYYQVLWEFASNERDISEKLKAYYPNSKYVSRLKTLLDERERKRKEEERKHIEAERKRKAEERKRIKAERKRKAEIERKRKEEERKHIEAELKRQKREEKERKRLEAERKKKEEIKRKKEEERRERFKAKFEDKYKVKIGKITGYYGRFGRGIRGKNRVVYDLKTGFEWLIWNNSNRLKHRFEMAKDWADSRNHDTGVKGWRLPTSQELRTVTTNEDWSQNKDWTRLMKLSGYRCNYAFTSETFETYRKSWDGRRVVKLANPTLEVYVVSNCSGMGEKIPLHRSIDVVLVAVRSNKPE